MLGRINTSKREEVLSYPFGTDITLKLGFWNKMKSFYFVFFIAFLLVNKINAAWKPVWLAPEQIHLSIGRKI